MTCLILSLVMFSCCYPLTVALHGGRELQGGRKTSQLTKQLYSNSHIPGGPSSLQSNCSCINMDSSRAVFSNAFSFYMLYYNKV